MARTCGKLYIAVVAIGLIASIVFTARGIRVYDPGLWNGLGMRLGNHYMDGVYIGKRGYLLEDIASPQKGVMAHKADVLNEFMSRHGSVSFSVMLVPDKASLLRHRLPAFAQVSDQQQIFSRLKNRLDERIRWIDVSAILRSHRMEDIYFKTDSRWTSLGAFYAAQTASEAISIPKAQPSEFEIVDLSDSFTGDLARRIGVQKQKDTLSVYIPKETDNSVFVIEPYSGEGQASLYDTKALKSDDPYGVFPAAGASLTYIRTMAGGGRRLLLVQDSFGSALIPFLTPHYSEIVVVNPQLYGGNIDDLLVENHLTECLLVYGGNTFVSDEYMETFFEHGGVSGTPTESKGETAGSDAGAKPAAEPHAGEAAGEGADADVQTGTDAGSTAAVDRGQSVQEGAEDTSGGSAEDENMSAADTDVYVNEETNGEGE